MGRGWQCFEVCARNMEAKGNSGESLDGNGEHVIGNWKKGDPCYKVVKDVAKMCSSVLWKREFMSDEIGYLAEELSKQSIEGVAWVSLTAYSKMQKKRDEDRIVKRK